MSSQILMNFMKKKLRGWGSFLSLKNHCRYFVFSMALVFINFAKLIIIWNSWSDFVKFGHGWSYLEIFDYLRKCLKIPREYLPQKIWNDGWRGRTGFFFSGNSSIFKTTSASNAMYPLRLFLDTMRLRIGAISMKLSKYRRP